MRLTLLLLFLASLLFLNTGPAHAAATHTELLPSHSTDSFDFYMELLPVDQKSTSTARKESAGAATKDQVQKVEKEYAVCKAASACAGKQLPCPATCVKSFYGGGFGYGSSGNGGGGYGYGGYHGKGYGYGGGYGKGYGGGYGKGYGYGGGSHGGYGYGRGGYGGGGGGYGGGGGGYGGGGGGYGGGGYGGGGGGDATWLSACKYDCLSGCKASCD